MKVLVNGATGKMGREVLKAVHNDTELTLVGGVDPSHGGKDVSEFIGTSPLNCKIYSQLEEGIEAVQPDVIVDFTTPAIIFDNAKLMLSKGIHVVIGTTGLTEAQRNELDAIGRAHGANCLVAPNFSLGAVMMMKTAAELAPYFPDVEIIELHHNHKYDAPSGTAVLTAKLINDAKQAANVKAAEDLTRESLPGYVAHQEVIFGGYDETLVIRHDSLSRLSFMPGVVLACKKIKDFAGLTYGLEHYL